MFNVSVLYEVAINTQKVNHKAENTCLTKQEIEVGKFGP